MEIKMQNVFDGQDSQLYGAKHNRKFLATSCLPIMAQLIVGVTGSIVGALSDGAES